MTEKIKYTVQVKNDKTKSRMWALGKWSDVETTTSILDAQQLLKWYSINWPQDCIFRIQEKKTTVRYL